MNVGSRVRRVRLSLNQSHQKRYDLEASKLCGDVYKLIINVVV